jgi:hypothetical protein
MLSVEVTDVDLAGSVVQASGGEELRFTIPLEVTNLDDEDLSTAICVWEIQQLVGSSWKSVYAPACRGSDYETAIIQGNETRQMELDIAAPLSLSAETRWTGSASGGTYRLVTGLLPSAGRPRKLSGGESNSFVLTW